MSDIKDQIENREFLIEDRLEKFRNVTSCNLGESGLQNFTLGEVISLCNIQTDELYSLSLKDSPGKVVEIFSTTDQKIIPIIDEQKSLIGIVDFEEVKAVIFNPNHVKFMTMSEIMTQPKELVLFEDKPEKIMKLFETSKATILPVIFKGKYFGFLSKIDILESYRHRLKEMIIE
jgi:CIC family chloride channel protein